MIIFKSKWPALALACNDIGHTKVTLTLRGKYTYVVDLDPPEMEEQVVKKMEEYAKQKPDATLLRPLDAG